jgi:hypothetical protein
MSAPTFMLASRGRLLLRLTLATAASLAVLPAAASGNASVFKDACPAGVAGASCVYYTGLGSEFDAYDFTADASFVYLTPTRLNDNPALALGCR